MFFMLAGWLLQVAAVMAQQPLRFTMDIASPAPIPGQPYAITWTGGEASGAIYISLDGYFELTPKQDIIYTRDDILSSAPNNGSWTYNVPLNIRAGRHSFSIGINPILWSDTTPIWRIDSSQTSFVAPAPSATVQGSSFSWNGCGLPPIPDYTYTGYQPPCTVTTNGHLTTIYPLAPASISSLWFASNSVAAASSSPKITSSIATSSNTALASGVFAQALQCTNPVTPSTTKILSGGVTTVISLVACSTGVSAGNALNGNAQGVCHVSGDTTFSVSGSYSVCCPNGWATTPLVKNLFCYTAIAGGDVEKRAVTQTLPGESVRIDGIAFARAGVVTDGSTATGSSSNIQVISMPVTTTSVGGTGASGTSTVNSSMTTGGTHKLNANVQAMLVMIGLLYIMI